MPGATLDLAVRLTPRSRRVHAGVRAHAVPATVAENRHAHEGRGLHSSTLQINLSRRPCRKTRMPKTGHSSKAPLAGSAGKPF